MITAKPTITNTTLTSAATEYSYTFPAGTYKFEIRLRSGSSLLQIAFVSGASGTTYITIPYGASYAETDAKVGGSVIYFQSPDAAQVAEIKIWK